MHAGNVSPGRNHDIITIDKRSMAITVLSVKFSFCCCFSWQGLFGFGGKTGRQRHSGGTGWRKGMAPQQAYLA